ncbi:MAG: hypothetical protein ACTSXU_17645, partial [Promethearchaeota archaeon]
GYSSNVALMDGKFHPDDEWLRETINLELPDVFKRLFGFFDYKYSCNLIVTSKFEYQYVSIFSAKEKGNKIFENKRSHGGLYRIESVVPLIIAGPRAKNGSIIQMGRNIDVLPTILSVIGKKIDPEDFDGKILEGVFDD